MRKIPYTEGDDSSFEITCLKCNSIDCELKIVSK